MKKWIIFCINLVVFMLVFMKRDLLYAWIAGDNTASLPLMFLVITILAMFPVIPFGIVGGVIGAKYGVVLGSTMNVAISTLAAIIVYLLAKYLLYSWGRRITQRFTSLDQLHAMSSQRLFWMILSARIIPILPAAAINIYAGVFHLNFKIFILATLLGKIPAMMTFAYIGHEIWNEGTRLVQVSLMYASFLLLVFIGYRIYLRYKE
ncbi:MULTISPECIES: TVP38/TMEM64 family protein [Paenibacillus]|uniref:TVP38/TMEM64 family membrane protein n=3 Tax=Bacillales TaxID=1385 RepID=A0A7Y6EU82_9BACL|nr:MULTISPECIES: VTT domain-containing protein [Paenibacillus]KGP77473.1 hypothetical protein P363_0133255 [Paenibacillus sp. MAEPY1]KGP77501.1 hypothetical protein P364_0132925 [Paenibacillus sp. MAEPY2]MDN4605359.1 VTT domain-containing protein [Paenibacillus vandeheii]MDN8593131.1 VTT domain-containing protein [Paenibacillus sp. 11B]NUU75356.1 TVP38/TMEM64 family protein [Paenibacillus xylanilyticus]